MLMQWSVVRRVALTNAMVWCAHAVLDAQTLAGLHGRVLDESGAALPSAVVRVQNESIGFDVSVQTNTEGRYYVGGQGSDLDADHAADDAGCCRDASSASDSSTCKPSTSGRCSTDAAGAFAARLAPQNAWA